MEAEKALEFVVVSAEIEEIKKPLVEPKAKTNKPKFWYTKSKN